MKWHLLTHTRLQKIRNLREILMVEFITYVNIRIKNYLKLLYSNLNSPREEAVPYQALAIAIIKNKINGIKKNIKENYSNFLAITVILPSSLMSTCQSILSPAFTFNIFTISLGKPTRREFDLGFA